MTLGDDNTQPPNVVNVTSITQLTTQMKEGQKADRAERRIDQIALRMEICDGTVPRRLRQWLSEVGGFLKDNFTDLQILELAKASSSGELRQEIRDFTARATDPIIAWEAAETEIRRIFIPTVDTLKLKHRFSTYQQFHSETTPNYVRRFKIDVLEAYGITVVESDMLNLIGCFLRGLNDRNMARGIGAKDKQVLSEVLALTLQHAENADKLYHMFLRPGQEPRSEEPMDQSAITHQPHPLTHPTQVPDPPTGNKSKKEKVERSEVQKLTDQVATLTTLVKKKFGAEQNTPAPQKQQQRQNFQPQGNQNQQPPSVPSYRPVSQDTRRCFECNQMGHFKRNCPRLRRPPRYDARQAARCYNCDKMGHYASECYQSHPRTQFNVRNPKNWSAP